MYAFSGRTLSCLHVILFHFKGRRTNYDVNAIFQFYGVEFESGFDLLGNYASCVFITHGHLYPLPDSYSSGVMLCQNHIDL